MNTQVVLAFRTVLRYHGMERYCKLDFDERLVFVLFLLLQEKYILKLLTKFQFISYE